MSEKEFLANNLKKQDIQRDEFYKLKGDPDLIVRDPYTGDPWEYNEEITKLFNDMIVLKATN